MCDRVDRESGLGDHPAACDELILALSLRLQGICVEC